MPLFSAAAAASPMPAVFDLKSATLTSLALLLRSPDLDVLRQDMAQRWGETPEVFSHDPVLIDLSLLQGEDAVDFAALVALLKGHKLLPVGVRGGSAEQLAAALEAGLGEVPDSGPAATRQEARAVAAAEAMAPALPEAPAASTEASPPSAAAGSPNEVMSEQDPAPEAALVAAAPAPARSTVIVDKPLRSGQQVYAKGADLVVMAAVNQGAEVIADGSIHVYAPLRGKAIAGAMGNTEARIFAAVMEPELISIAGIYRAIEEPLAPDVQGKAAQIKLDGEKLLMEALRY